MVVNLTRRALLKGIGALAGSTVLPKGITNLATKEAVKKIPYAPPWVGSMINTLQRAPLHGEVPFAQLANKTAISKMGSTTKKIYGGKTAKETHFKVKPAANVAAHAPEDRIYRQTDWDDIVLTEEPGQTSITWKNKDLMITAMTSTSSLTTKTKRQDSLMTTGTWRPVAKISQKMIGLNTL
jgi:hypothetical protein